MRRSTYRLTLKFATLGIFLSYLAYKVFDKDYFFLIDSLFYYLQGFKEKGLILINFCLQLKKLDEISATLNKNFENGAI